MIGIIAAMTLDRVIGIYDSPGDIGRIPWIGRKSFMEPDLKRFQEITLDSSVIMGRKTWESIGSRSLPRRKNIIISSTINEPAGLEYRVCKTVDEVMSWSFTGNIWFIGGREIYKDAMKWADTIDITIIPMLSRQLCSSVSERVFFPVVDDSLFERKNLVHPYNKALRTIRYVRK